MPRSNVTISGVTSSPKQGYVTEVELFQLMKFCHTLLTRHRSIDYYATIFGIGLIIILGILGNAGTLLTLSGRRLTTATFVYYRAIAFTDLFRCVFVFSYFLRVVVPFRNHYKATWYEAHVMYFGINTLSFVSTSLAVTLCVRLCIGILQSRRLKKTKTNPRTTRIYIYMIVAAAVLVNGCLCFEYDVVQSIDYCARNRTIRPNEYMITPTSFHAQNVGLLRAIHLLPIVILLVLLCGAGSILGCCLYAMPRTTTNRKIPSGPKRSTNALLIHHCPSVRQSRPWRTQRQLCKLFLLLSFCYAVGLLPEFLNMVAFSKVDGCNCTSTAENYRSRIRHHFDRENFASISNIFQNIGHALCFYVYLMCSDAFRSEFLAKLRRFRSRFCSAIWPYSNALGCTSVAAIISEKSQSSDTKQALRSVTLLAELDSDQEFATTFAPERVIDNDHTAIELLDSPRTFAAAAVCYTDAPVFTLAALARRMSAQLAGLDSTILDKNFLPPPSYGALYSEESCNEDKEEEEKNENEDEYSMNQEANTLTDRSTVEGRKPDSFSPVQLPPNRYHSFYKSGRKRPDEEV